MALVALMNAVPNGALADRAVIRDLEIPNLQGLTLGDDPRAIYLLDGKHVVVMQRGSSQVLDRLALDTPLEAIVADDERDLLYVTATPRGFRPSPGTVHVIDASPLRIIETIEVDRIPLDAVLDAASDRLFVANFRSQTISAIDTRERSVSFTIRTLKRIDAYPVHMAFNARTGRLYVVTELGGIFAFDGRSGELVARTRPNRWLEWPDVAVDERTDRVFVTHPDRTSVLVLDGDLSSAGAPIELTPQEPYHLAVNEQARLLYVGGDDASDDGESTLDVIDLDSHEVLERVPLGHYAGEIELDPARYRSYMSSGSSLLVISEDSTPPVPTIWGPDTAVMHDDDRLQGTATDNVSGVRKVTALYRSAAGTTRQPADVRCRDGGRRLCSWSAPAPPVPGLYRVTVVAVDRAGSRALSEREVTIARLP